MCLNFFLTMSWSQLFVTMSSESATLCRPNVCPLTPNPAHCFHVISATFKSILSLIAFVESDVCQTWLISASLAVVYGHRHRNIIIYLRLRAVFGARWEPFCRARCELIVAIALCIIEKINDDDDENGNEVSNDATKLHLDDAVRSDQTMWWERRIQLPSPTDMTVICTFFGRNAALRRCGLLSETE